MKAPLSYVPALPAAAGIVTGIIIYSVDATLSIITAVAAVALFFILYFRDCHYSAFFPLMVAVGLMFSFGADNPPLHQEYLSGKHNISAKVTDVRGFDNISLLIRIDTIDGMPVNPVNACCALFDATDTLPRGCRVQLLSSIHNVAAEGELPYVNGYGDFLLSKGIDYQINRPDEIRMTHRPGWLDRSLNDAHDAIFRAIVDAPLKESTSAFLLGVILGDRHFIEPYVSESFRSIGLAHILAISGLHVGVLASLITLLLSPLRLTRRGRAIGSAAVVALIWIYAAICGMGPSITRAAVMITVFTISDYIQRGYFVFNSLLLSVIVILCLDPDSLFTPGFQLSVAAVASILAFSILMPDKIRRYLIIYFLINLAIASISAMATTGIISAYYFHTFPVMFLCANILAGMLFPLIFIAGIIITVAKLAGFDLVLLGHGIDLLLDWLVSLSDTLADIGKPEIRGICFSAWAILPYLLALFALAWHIRKPKPFLLPLAASLLVLSVIVAQNSSPDIPSAELFITGKSDINIIYREGKTATVFTLCEDENRIPTAHRCDKAYNSYLKARDCPDTFAIASDKYSAGALRIDYPYVVAADKVFYLAGDNDLKYHKNIDIDYLLVQSGFTGDINDLTMTLCPDTILIAANTHPLRRDKWLRRLDSSPIPVIDLRDKTFSISWE